MAAPCLTDCSKSENFTEVVAGTGKLIVVHFYAPWADQCAQMNDVLVELMKDKQLTDVVFLKAEAEEVPEISEKYSIDAVPTFIFLKNNKEVDRLNGANATELTKKVKQLALVHGGLDANIEHKQTEDLDTRLRRLTHAADVMLFMKGTADEPKCGFSRQITAILNDHGIKFNSFNILEDEQVRQGLKTFSDWPTFPQLYIKGELIGGLDIVKEYVETDELKSLLGNTSLDDRLKSLINSAPVLLFMKGTRGEPRCGFSRSITTILNDSGIPYETFNILTDETVRQGLKKYSDWPTYPQLYVKGDLIGGLDIVQELKETGELITTLKGE